MKLFLNNIKQHSGLMLEFPEKGMVLLKGPSGAGKTSILESIKFGLYDGDDLLSWGKKTAMVGIKWRDMDISKNIGPEALILNSVLHDAAAQSEINNNLGMTEEEFSASSYITQDQAESLLNLKPTAQLAFIQKLVSGSVDIDKVKATSRNIIKGKEAALQVAKDNSTRLQLDFATLEGELSGISVELPDEEPPVVHEEDLKQVQNEIKNLQKRSEEVETRRNLLSKDLSHPAHKFRAEYETNKKNLTEQLAVALQEVSVLDGAVQETTPWVKISREQVQESKQRIVKGLKYLEFKDTFRKFKEEVLAKYPDFEGKKLIAALKERRDLLTESYKVCSVKIANLNIELGSIRAAKDTLTCPSCSSKLRFDGKKLVCALEGEVHLDREPVVQFEIDSFFKKQKENTDETSDIVHYLVKMNQLQQSLLDFKDVDPDKTLEIYESETQELDRYIEAQNKISAVVSIRNRDLEKARKNVQVIQQKYEQLQETCDTYSDIPTLNVFNMLIEEANTELAQFSSNLQQQNLVNAELLETKGRREIYEIKAQQVKDLKAQVDRKYAECMLSGIAQAECENNLRYAHKAQDIIRKASVDSIVDIIESLNSNAAYYIGKVFPEGNTSVTIRNSKQLKNGDEKPDLSVVINHKGSVVKKLASLSGGEKARLTLAFQLALSDLYKSPILLVDEACSGLDEETKEKCFELLREVASDKLVICVEHSAPEFLMDVIIDI